MGIFLPRFGAKMRQDARMVMIDAHDVQNIKKNDDSVEVGDVLDERYALDEIVGRGGCGVVFRATDLNLQRDVAVKVLSAEGGCNADMLERFERESQILRRLHSPNTVFFYDSGQTPQGLPYIVMEFVTGIQLKALLDEKTQIDPETAVPILMQVFQSLSEAHDYGFVHRDLKPSNIMLCERIGFPGYFVKVLDFGVAKIMSEDESDASKHDNMAGTPRYMAPEQFKNEVLTPAADLYAMGCIAYEMLTGIAPFDGDTLHVTVAKHLFMTPRSLGEKFEAYPNLCAIVFKLLEKQPADRFASAQDVLLALEHWQEPERLPSLQNARIHGDDDEENGFFSDKDESDSKAIPQAYAEAMHRVRLKGIYAMPQDSENPVPSPLDIAAAEHCEQLQSQYALASVERQKGKRRVYVAVVGGMLFIAAVAAIFFFVVGRNDDLRQKTNSVALESDGVPRALQRISAQQLAFLTDAVSFEMAQSAFVATGFGVLSRREILDLKTEAELFDMEIEEELEAGRENAEVGHEEDDENSKKAAKKKKKKKRRGSSSSSKNASGEIEPFSFTLKYSPTKARVGFLDARGQCSDGVCQVQTTSTHERARVVVSSPGFVTQSIIVSEKVDSLRVVLVPEA